jgi:glycerol-3-phosphate acyltransferase PlsX
MGGDHAPVETVAGAVQAAREFGMEVVLVGRPDDLQRELAKHQTAGLHLPIEAAASVIPMDEHNPSTAWRRQRDSSLVVAMNLLHEGKVTGVVSAGNTGAVVAASLFIVRRIEGIDRPCLGATFPARCGPVLVADVGATPDARPIFLLQWAQMAALYAERALGIRQPKVGLLSNGEEEVKGNELVREAFPLLKASGLNFYGMVEGRDIAEGTVDVVITDGFTGNVAIKTAEGVGALIATLLREELSRSPLTKLLAVGALPALNRLRRRMDYAEYGGGPVLGVQGVVVKAHGRSNARAIRSALRVAHQAVERDTLAAFAAIGVQEVKRDA